MRKPTKERLRKLADRLLQETICRLNPYCFSCGKPTQVAHHHFPKSISSRLRYEVMNCVPLCNSCHFSHHQKFNPQISAAYRKRMGGDKWEEELAKIKQETVKTDKKFYEDAIAKLNSL